MVNANDIPWEEAFRRAPVALSLVDAHGRQLAGNDAYAELLGFPVGSSGPDNIGAVTRDQDRSWTASYLTRLVNGDLDRFTTHKVFQRADGSEVRAQLTTRALRDDDDLCFALIGTLVPSSETQRIQDARLHMMMEFSLSTFTVVDAEGTVIESSGRYQPILGYPTEFWETRTIMDLLLPEEIDRVMEFRERVLSAPRERLEIEVQVRAADGSIQDIAVQAVNLLDDDVGGIILTSQNITGQRQLVNELSLRSSTAEAVAKAQTNLLATVSHELRNPLHAIQGLAELLAAEQLPPRAAELATTLASQLTGLAGVTQDLLDTARLDSGTVQLDPRPTDMHALVNEVVEYGTAMVGDRELAVRCTIMPNTPPWVLVDAARLRQVLRNLVGNAIKFTTTGGVTLEVRPALTNGVQFSIADTGVGIPADEIDSVMRPFQTGSTGGDSRGAGLGLAIVQRLVSAMHGSLTLHSVLGTGTTFTVVLPLPVADAPAPRAVEQQQCSEISVLVVEDNPVNQQLARSQLARLGMTPVIVGSGEEALELLDRPDHPHFDVVLMDHQLPGIDGVETTRRIRTLGASVASIPVIGLTASASATHRESFLNAGMDGFLAKPATMDDIRNAINEVLDDKWVRPAEAAAAAAPVAVQAATVQTAVLAKLAGELGDRIIVVELVTSFLAELPKRGTAITSAIAAGDTAAAGRAAHTLKSSARLLGANTLADMCQEIEHLQPVDVPALERLLQAAKDELFNWKAEE